MKHRITHKTKDGSLKEQVFDDFNEFAEKIQDVAIDYYAGNLDSSRFDVETIYNDMIRKERVTDGFDGLEGGTELLTEEN